MASLENLTEARSQFPSHSHVQMLAGWALPGQPESVTLARAFVRAILAGYPQVDLAEWLVSEVFTNSVKHSLSGSEPYGTISVDVALVLGDHVQVLVVDDGGPNKVRDRWNGDVMAEGGRGWHLVEQLSTACGSLMMDDEIRFTWFELAPGTSS